MKKSEILNALYKDNSLEKEDVYKDKRGFTIITRSGIEKIQANNNIEVEFKLINWELDNCVIKATSFIDGKKKMETYASATKENCMQKFRVEIAEKRSLARVIIKTMNLTNTLGQDEVEHQGKNIVNK
tara:strand:+ start:48 stop:431 length:384 start_codon:yes stop_codon:yes gene_type:complete